MNLLGFVGWAVFFAHAEKDGRATQAHPTVAVISTSSLLQVSQIQ